MYSVVVGGLLFDFLPYLCPAYRILRDNYDDGEILKLCEIVNIFALNLNWYKNVE